MLGVRPSIAARGCPPVCRQKTNSEQDAISFRNAILAHHHRARVAGRR